MHRLFASTALALCLGLLGSPASAETQPKAVIATYVNLAQAMYEDAALAATDLQKAVDSFLATPTAETLKAARTAWVNARPWYMQTEAYRFGNPLMDELEGKVNSWPLDEGLIDYVDVKSYGSESEENPFFRANIIANKRLKVGKTRIDASKITPKLISETLATVGGVKENVASGYHAVEFLLWGQDLNGTGPGAGNRQASDYDLKACTNGNCDRRRAYLKVATDLLVKDVQTMANAWTQSGKARADLLAKPENEGLAAIFTGLGSLSYGELAGERMKLGLILHDPEEEHDCFSDNTHNSHYYDQRGMAIIWRGNYTRRDGSTVSGPSLQALTSEKASEAAAKMNALFDDTEAKFLAIKQMGDSGKMAYDQMIAAGNSEGNTLVQDGINALVAQTRGLEAVVAALNLQVKVGGSDSLDKPSETKKRR